MSPYLLAHLCRPEEPKADGNENYSFILGLSWGGNLYHWSDAHVVAMIVVGVCCLIALFLYESFVPLKEPMIPVHLFKNIGWCAAVISLSLGASVYYSQAIVWPGMTATVYAHGRLMWAGWVGSLAGIGITVGEIIGGMMAKRVGKTKFQVIFIMVAATAVMGGEFLKSANLVFAHPFWSVSKI